MFKDILVHVPTERPMRPVVDASISLASALGAHLDAVATGYVSASAAYVGDGNAAFAVASIFEMEQERAEERATTALSAFDRSASRVSAPAIRSVASGNRAL